MNKATPTPRVGAEEDAAFDEWLAAADAESLERAGAAFDLDAGCAAIFAATVVPETVREEDGDSEHWEHLEVTLRAAAESIAPWLALRGLFALPHQLDKAITTTRTMTVVGRVLLPDTMHTYWGLASDFLADCNADLARLKYGLLRREITREDAMVIHRQASADITNFRTAFQQYLDITENAKAHRVGERLISTAEMLILLLGWIHDSIAYVFNDTDCPATASVP